MKIAGQTANKDEIVGYFENTACDYDASRFGSNYGRFIDAEERAVLREWLAKVPPGHVLDMGCGTGRFLEFADYGLDPSAKMLEVARRKYPHKHLYVGSLGNLKPPCGLPAAFQAIICMHVLMHLPPAEVEEIISLCADRLAPQGWLIIGVLSRKRRQIRRSIGHYRPQGWHGSSPLSSADVERLARGRFRLAEVRGVHLFPNSHWISPLRPVFVPLERLLSTTPLADYYRFLMLRLQKVRNSQPC